MPLPIALKSGGSFILRATATDSEGRTTTTELDFYALGEGYTAWRRYDHQRIDLLPEKTTYKPGETARILIKSPWEQATALITTEREGIRSQRRFALTSTHADGGSADHRGGHPERLRVGAAGERPHEGRDAAHADWRRELATRQERREEAGADERRGR